MRRSTTGDLALIALAIQSEDDDRDTGLTVDEQAALDFLATVAPQPLVVLKAAQLIARYVPAEQLARVVAANVEMASLAQMHEHLDEILQQAAQEGPGGGDPTQRVEPGNNAVDEQ